MSLVPKIVPSKAWAFDTSCGYYSVAPHLPAAAIVVGCGADGWGYLAPKLIGPQRAIVALHDYLTTRGIVFVDPRDGGVIRRYCYQDRMEALTQFLLYQDPTQHPGGNWIKHKGLFNGHMVDDLNPEWSKS